MTTNNKWPVREILGTLHHARARLIPRISRTGHLLLAVISARDSNIFLFLQKY
jgi:hypothetical protein